MTTTAVMTIQEVVNRFNELAIQEKWFDIQDELFADNVKSIEPAHSHFMKYAEGKKNVHTKAMNFVSKITARHSSATSKPIVSGNHFAVSRQVDIDHSEFGRIMMDEIMLYEVKDGQIISEQFFY
jgi:hypothetical protein